MMAKAKTKMTSTDATICPYLFFADDDKRLGLLANGKGKGWGTSVGGRGVDYNINNDNGSASQDVHDDSSLDVSHLARASSASLVKEDESPLSFGDMPGGGSNDGRWGCCRPGARLCCPARAIVVAWGDARPPPPPMPARPIAVDIWNTEQRRGAHNNDGTSSSAAATTANSSNDNNVGKSAAVCIATAVPRTPPPAADVPPPRRVFAQLNTT